MTCYFLTQPIIGISIYRELISRKFTYMYMLASQQASYTVKPTNTTQVTNYNSYYVKEWTV